MNLKKRLVTVPCLGLALTVSTIAAPLSLAQDQADGGVTNLVRGKARKDADVSAVSRDAESHCGSAAAAHWALYQRLRGRSLPVSPSGPDFSGDWLLDMKGDDDSRERAKEAAQASRQAAGSGRGMGGGRQGRGGVMAESGNLSSGELSALPAPAQALHILHEDPMLLIADESDRRQRLFTDFRGATMPATAGTAQHPGAATPVLTQ